VARTAVNGGGNDRHVGGIRRGIWWEERNLYVGQGRKGRLDERPEVVPGEAAVAAARGRDRHGPDLAFQQYAHQVDEAGLDVGHHPAVPGQAARSPDVRS